MGRAPCPATCRACRNCAENTAFTAVARTEISCSPWTLSAGRLLENCWSFASRCIFSPSGRNGGKGRRVLFPAQATHHQRRRRGLHLERARPRPQFSLNLVALGFRHGPWQIDPLVEGHVTILEHARHPPIFQNQAAQEWIARIWHEGVGAGPHMHSSEEIPLHGPNNQLRPAQRLDVARRRGAARHLAPSRLLAASCRRLLPGLQGRLPRCRSCLSSVCAPCC